MRYIILILLLTACGKDDSKGTEPTNAAVHQVEPVTTTTNYAMAVDSLPVCDKDHEAQLVYDTTEQGFYTCKANKWAGITIKGENGKDGKDGTAGTNGKDGSDGKNAQDPKPALAENEWIDTGTGNVWWMSIDVREFFYDKVCPSNFHHPSDADLLVAVFHGLLMESKNRDGPSTAWETDPINRHYQIVFNTNEMQVTAGATAGVFCIKDAP